MKRALKSTKMTAPGKDQMSYLMLKNLGVKALNELLCLINKVWTQGRLLSNWKEAVIVPIRKPGIREGPIYTWQLQANCPYVEFVQIDGAHVSGQTVL